MKIEIARTEDIDDIMDVFEAAKRFMRQTGNIKQWVDGYPHRELILDNIRAQDFYVCLSDDGQMAGVFYFKMEEDKTYAHIYDGEWLNDEPYGVVHRIASNGTRKGIAAFCLQWCLEQCGNVRVDTHRDNRVMQAVLRKNGYRRCGIIYIADGTERIAFQKSLINPLPKAHLPEDRTHFHKACE
ncbi:MAG: GNAT family N-acetyltransferase [Tannerella sp.]|jgi:RimJ/RimL family protein N-acetyltransferase|nr:GNAT family N-acetyltransferase [Tannerella sp.]